MKKADTNFSVAKFIVDKQGIAEKYKDRNKETKILLMSTLKKTLIDM